MCELPLTLYFFVRKINKMEIIYIVKSIIYFLKNIIIKEI